MGMATRMLSYNARSAERNLETAASETDLCVGRAATATAAV